MIRIVESATKLIGKSEIEIRNNLVKSDENFSVIFSSIHKIGNSLLFIVESEDEKRLIIVSETVRAMPKGFSGTAERLSDASGFFCGKLDYENAKAICRYFLKCRPIKRSGQSDLLQFASYEEGVFFSFINNLNDVFGFYKEISALNLNNFTLKEETLLRVFFSTDSSPINPQISSEYANNSFVCKEKIVSFSEEEANVCTQYFYNQIKLLKIFMKDKDSNSFELEICIEDISTLKVEQIIIFVARELKKNQINLTTLIFPKSDIKLDYDYAIKYFSNITLGVFTNNSTKNSKNSYKIEYI